MVFSSDGTRIVSSSRDKINGIWNAQNGQLVAGPFKHTDEVYCVAISPDGTRVVSGSRDGTLRIWDAESGKIDSDSGPQRVHEAKAVRFSADGTCVISDKGATWRIEDGKVISEGSGESERRTLAITDGMEFSFKGTLEWDPYSGKVTSNLDRISGYPKCIAVSPNGKRIAFGSRDGSIRVWDRERDVLVCRPFEFGYIRLHSPIYSPGSMRIAKPGEFLWLNTHYPSVNSIAYSPCGRHVASGYDDIRKNSNLESWQKVMETAGK